MTDNIIAFKTSKWIKFNFLGWLLGVVLILILSSFLESIGIHDMQFYLGVGMGGGVGIAQWWVLRRILDINTNWIWASVFGMGVPFVIIDVLPLDTIDHKLALSIIIGALVVGLLQYVILKPFSSKAYLWIIACFVGWILAVGTVFIIDYTNYLKQVINNLILALINLALIFLGGIVMGVITNIAIQKIIKLSRPI